MRFFPITSYYPYLCFRPLSLTYCYLYLHRRTSFISKGKGQLVVNLMSSQFLSTQCLGQATIDLASIPALYQDEFDSREMFLQLGFPSRTIYGQSYQPIEAEFRDTDGKTGGVILSVQVPPVLENACGWFWVMSNGNSFFSSMLGLNTDTPIWVVLYKGFLNIYESPFTDEVIRSIDCIQIKSVAETSGDLVKKQIV